MKESKKFRIDDRKVKDEVFDHMLYECKKLGYIDMLEIKTVIIYDKEVDSYTFQSGMHYKEWKDNQFISRKTEVKNQKGFMKFFKLKKPCDGKDCKNKTTWGEIVDFFWLLLIFGFISFTIKIASAQSVGGIGGGGDCSLRYERHYRCTTAECLYKKSKLVKDHCGEETGMKHRVLPSELYKDGEHLIYDANGMPISYNPYAAYKTNDDKVFRVNLDKTVSEVYSIKYIDNGDPPAKTSTQPYKELGEYGPWIKYSRWISERQMDAYMSYARNSVCIVTINERYRIAIEKYLGFDYKYILEHVENLYPDINLDSYPEEELCYLHKEFIYALKYEVKKNGTLKRYHPCRSNGSDRSIFSCLVYIGSRIFVAYAFGEFISWAFTSVPETTLYAFNEYGRNKYYPGLQLSFYYSFGGGVPEPGAFWASLAKTLLKGLGLWLLNYVGDKAADSVLGDDEEEEEKKDEPEKPEQQEEEKPKCNPEYQTCGIEGGLRLL